MRFYSFKFLFLFTSILSFFYNVNANSKNLSVEVVATVNNKAITSFDLEERVQFISNSTKQKKGKLQHLKEDILTQMVDEYIISAFVIQNGNAIEEKVLENIYNQNKVTVCKMISKNSCITFIKGEIIKSNIMSSFPAEKKNEKLIEFIARAKKFIPSEVFI